MRVRRRRRKRRAGSDRLEDEYFLLSFLCSVYISLLSLSSAGSGMGEAGKPMILLGTGQRC